MSNLTLRNVSKVYPNNNRVVKDFNLDIKEQEFVIFVGPSGCGKSTTLRMIAGLEEISAGELCQLHDSAPEYAGALLSVFPEARQVVETQIENMVNGKSTAEEAVAAMAKDINASIEDYNLLNE